MSEMIAATGNEKSAAQVIDELRDSLAAAQRENQRLREALVSAKKWIPVGGGGAFEMHEQIDAALALTEQEKP